MPRRLRTGMLLVVGWVMLGGVAPAAPAGEPVAYELRLTVGGIEGSPFGLKARPGTPVVGSLELLPPAEFSSVAPVARFSLTIGNTTWTEADITHSKVSVRGGEVHWRDSVLRATKGSPPVKVVLGRYINAATDERRGSETLSFADVRCHRVETTP